MEQAYTLALTGQSLIKRPLTRSVPGFAEVRNAVRAADHAFTNFEGAIKGKFGGAATKTEYLSAVTPDVLDDLKDIGFDLLSLCNNHAYDYGSGGILSTVEEVKQRGFTWAGAGKTLDEASQPGWLLSPRGNIALVGMDCGRQPDQVYARSPEYGEAGHPGINPMRMIEQGDRLVLNEGDWARNAACIQRARETADLVVVYTHSHRWSEILWNTPKHMVDLYHRCVEMGADVVVGHGTPALQGIEIYRQKPLFYGLGNFIFHSANPQQWLSRIGIRPWQSVIATCHWSSSKKVRRIDLIPICIGHNDDPGEDLPQVFHDVPVTASKDYGRRILTELAVLSAVFGTELHVSDGKASIDVH